jgi:hypothetical protein
VPGNGLRLLLRGSPRTGIKPLGVPWLVIVGPFTVRVAAAFTVITSVASVANATRYKL